MHSQNALNFFQILVQAGATPGTDFSFDVEEGICSLTERGYTLLREAYPDMDWDDCVEVVERDPSEAIAALHNHLGVNFIEQIVEKISIRLTTLPEEKAAWYLYQILDGVECKTGIPLYHVLQSKLSLSQQLHVEQLLRDDSNAVPCGEWLVDLVIAAGGCPDDAILEYEDALVTERGMRLLASVWTGSLNPLEELAKRAA